MFVLFLSHTVHGPELVQSRLAGILQKELSAKGAPKMNDGTPLQSVQELVVREGASGTPAARAPEIRAAREQLVEMRLSLRKCRESCLDSQMCTSCKLRRLYHLMQVDPLWEGHPSSSVLFTKNGPRRALTCLTGSSSKFLHIHIHILIQI